MIKRLLLLAAVACLFACSSSSPQGAKKKVKLRSAALVKFEAQTRLKKDWSVKLGSGVNKRYGALQPAINGDTLYLADAKGKVFSVNGKTGKKNWSVDTKTNIGGAIASYGDLLSFGTLDGQVITLSAVDGSEKWRAEVSSEVIARPAISKGVVVAQSIDGRLWAFNSETGEKKWRYDHTVPILTLRGASSPVIVRKQVIAAFDNGQVLSFGIDEGSIQWSARVSQASGRTDLDKIVDVDGSPVVEGSLVYAASYHGSVLAFSRAQGKSIWKQALSTSEPLAVNYQQVVGVSEESYVYAFNASNGGLLWKNTQLKLRGLAAPAHIGEYVAVIDSDDYLHLLSNTDGSFAYRFKPSGGGFRSPMTAYDGGLLVFSDDGRLTLYKISSKK
ncbi:MAG: outer membrane protein assembly factor BamB [Flavobacteriales bacterium]|jgi:outer membrane protein assembly factor BamB